MKTHDTAEKLHGNFVSQSHHPAPSHQRNFSGFAYLTQNLPWHNSYDGQEGLGTRFAKSATKAVIQKDQQGKQLQICM